MTACPGAPPPTVGWAFSLTKNALHPCQSDDGIFSVEILLPDDPSLFLGNKTNQHAPILSLRYPVPSSGTQNVFKAELTQDEGVAGTDCGDVQRQAKPF